MQIAAAMEDVRASLKGGELRAMEAAARRLQTITANQDAVVKSFGDLAALQSQASRVLCAQHPAGPTRSHSGCSGAQASAAIAKAQEQRALLDKLEAVRCTRARASCWPPPSPPPHKH